MSSKKTICLVTKNLSIKGGAQRVISLLAKELAKSYHVVVVSALFQKGGTLEYDFPEEVSVIIGSEGIGNMTKAILSTSRQVRKRIANEKVDVVLSIGAGAYLLAFAVTFLSKRKAVLCEHSSLANNIDISTAQKFYEWLGAKTADTIITLTEKDCKGYKEKYHIKNVRNIYNWIDTELVNNSTQYNREAKKIITVGRISKVKGFDMLLPIAKNVLETHPDWEWHIYGEGKLLPQIKKEAENMGITGQLIFKGQRDDIYQIYKDYSFCVMTSYHEGLPMVLLEAQANRLPLVSFDCETGPNEIITDQVNGYLIPPYDTKLMISKINALMDDEEKRADMSAHAWDTIDKFNKEGIMKQWIEVIEG